MYNRDGWNVAWNLLVDLWFALERWTLLALIRTMIFFPLYQGCTYANWISCHFSISCQLNWSIYLLFLSRSWFSFAEQSDVMCWAPWSNSHIDLCNPADHPFGVSLWSHYLRKEGRQRGVRSRSYWPEVYILWPTEPILFNMVPHFFTPLFTYGQWNFKGAYGHNFQLPPV